MKQIAAEEDVGLVSYTMTHHTRQSAVGLPLLKTKNYRGQEVSVTEYTMSEIVASVYECMEATGHETGILFIDEMNCVSETLTPVMLQLLQNKMFGCHHIPEGWLIVAAGNPPEYNRSVREFDMVTLDRVKHMTIEADLSVWRSYACENHIHPSILAFLNLYPDSFYVVESKDGVTSFVTARGWEDLSRILHAYMQSKDPIDEELILQYLQHDEIARNFYLFFDLFRDYTADFAAGNYFTGQTQTQLLAADATECVAVAAMLFSRTASMVEELTQNRRQSESLRLQKDRFCSMAAQNSLKGDTPSEMLADFIQGCKHADRIRETHGLLSLSEKLLSVSTIRQLEALYVEVQKNHQHALSEISHAFDVILKKKAEEQRDSSEKILHFIQDSYAFLEQAPSSICLTYFTADLAGNPATADYLANVYCEPWLRHSQNFVQELL